MRFQLFAKFRNGSSKNRPATPLTILNFSRAWRAHFLSNTLQTWQSCLFFVDLQLILLSLLDICDYMKFEKNEKAFLSICSELLGLEHGGTFTSYQSLRKIISLIHYIVFVKTEPPVTVFLKITKTIELKLCNII